MKLFLKRKFPYICAAVGFIVLIFLLASTYLASRNWAPYVRELLFEVPFIQKIKIKEAKWGGILAPLSLKIQKFQAALLLPNAPPLQLHISKSIAHFSFFSLLTGKWSLKKADIYNCTLHNSHEKLGTFTLLSYTQTPYRARLTCQELEIESEKIFRFIFPSSSFNLHLPLRVKGDFQIPPLQTFLCAPKSFFKGISQGNLEAESTSKVFYKDQEHFPEGIELDKISFKAKLTPSVLHLTRLELSQGPTTLCLNGNISPGKDVFSMDLKARAKHVSLKNLSSLWPQGINKKTRSWVTQRIRQGHVPEASLHFMGLFIPQDLSFKIDNLNGYINVKDATVRYIEEATPVTHVQGICHYTKDAFNIEASGRYKDLFIKKGLLNISALQAPGDPLMDIHLGIEGPLRTALEVISQPGLNLLEKLDVEIPSSLTGEQYTDLHLAFPLSLTPSPTSLKVSSSSSLKEISFNPSLDLPWKSQDQPFLRNGSFQLKTTNDGLELQGQALVLCHPCDISWKASFNPHLAKPLSCWKVLTSLTHGDLPLFLEKTSHQIPLEATLEEKENNEKQVKIRLDLRSISLNYPFLQLFKSPGSPLTLCWKSTVDALGNHHLQEGVLAGTNMKVSAKGSFTFQGPEKITLTLTQLGILKGKVKVQGPFNHLKITGGLEPIDGEKVLEAYKRSQEEQLYKGNLDLDLYIKAFHLDKTLTLRKLYNKIHLKEGRIYWAHLKANTPEAFELDLSAPKGPFEQQAQRFQVVSHNAGDFLDYLAPNNDLEGGILHMGGHIYTSHGKITSIETEMDVRNVVVKKAPFLAQLLSSASLQGLFNTLTGSGIYFDHGSGHVVWSPKKISFRNIHLGGGSLGLHLEGAYNRVQEDLTLQGEIYPFNGMNYLIANIPVVGNLLSGGNKKGVFSTPFLAQGKLNKLLITTNPFSTLAPGALRLAVKEATGRRQFPLENSPASPSQPRAKSDEPIQQKPHSPLH